MSAAHCAKPAPGLLAARSAAGRSCPTASAYAKKWLLEGGAGRADFVAAGHQNDAWALPRLNASPVNGRPDCQSVRSDGR